MNYQDYIQQICDSDVAGLKLAEKSYGDSWKRRGGVGAFMMLARKWDRLENAMSTTLHTSSETDVRGLPVSPTIDKYDILQRALADPRKEGLIDDIRDMRRYLVLIESELVAQGMVTEQPTD